MVVCDDEVSEAAMASDQEGENYMFSPFFYVLAFFKSNSLKTTPSYIQRKGQLPKEQGLKE